MTIKSAFFFFLSFCLFSISSPVIQLVNEMKTIKNKKVNIKPYSKKKISLKIKGKAGVDLNSTGISWSSYDSIVEPAYLN